MHLTRLLKSGTRLTPFWSAPLALGVPCQCGREDDSACACLGTVSSRIPNVVIVTESQAMGSVSRTFRCVDSRRRLEGCTFKDSTILVLPVAGTPFLSFQIGNGTCCFRGDRRYPCTPRADNDCSGGKNSRGTLNMGCTYKSKTGEDTHLVTLWRPQIC